MKKSTAADVLILFVFQEKNLSCGQGRRSKYNDQMMLLLLTTMIDIYIYREREKICSF